MENVIHTEKAPTSGSERIAMLDVLRGLAVMGILIMNIQSFSMPEIAYSNPSAYGNLTGLDLWSWGLSYVFADKKFLTMFSLLYGAGILLFSERLEAKGLSAWPVFLRRSGWLIAIGLLHGYVLWYGDILFSYGVCGLVVYSMRKIRPLFQMVIGLCAITLPFLLFVFLGLVLALMGNSPEAGLMQAEWQPSAEAIAREIAIYQGGIIHQGLHRIHTTFGMQTEGFLLFIMWRVGGVMLLGMALYQWGVLQGKRSQAFYLKLAIPGLLIGLALATLSAWGQLTVGFELLQGKFHFRQYNYWGSLITALGYIGLVALVAQRGWLASLLAPLGRMAFTNYLGQTVICTLIFYGHGLGLYGQVARRYQLLIVLGVWIVQIIGSKLWLAKYRFGPAEWLWRSLTYQSLQPMKRS